MRLTTPPAIRTLQRKRSVKAKTEPTDRFYRLYDKGYRADILAHAYALARANRGEPGVDGVTFEQVESSGLPAWRGRLQEDLRTRPYQPAPVRRVYIPKPGGGARPLGIPTVRDRVAQTAAERVLSPIFEADFTDELYGYRRRRSAHQAVAAVQEARRAGYTAVVDADLSKYFDPIPHTDLLKSVARRVSDGAMLHLLKLWLMAPVEERDGNGRGRRTGGAGHGRGTPQGGVLSPLLANVYMPRFLRAWREHGMDRHLKAKVVSYADDFVILCRGTAAEALALTHRWMRALKLTVNEKKTRVCDATQTPFDFLGYTFGPTVHRPTGRVYLAAQPSRKATARLRERVRTILHPGNQAPWRDVVRQVNQVVGGWQRDFSHGTVSRAYWGLDQFLLHRARGFLIRRHKLPGRGTQRFTADWLFMEEGLFHRASAPRAGRSHVVA